MGGGPMVPLLAASRRALLSVRWKGVGSMRLQPPPPQDFIFVPIAESLCRDRLPAVSRQVSAAAQNLAIRTYLLNFVCTAFNLGFHNEVVGIRGQPAAGAHEEA